jgi:hypothetical protein
MITLKGEFKHGRLRALKDYNEIAACMIKELH